MAQLWQEGQTPWSNVPNVNYAWTSRSTVPGGQANVSVPLGSNSFYPAQATLGASTITPTGGGAPAPTYSPPAPQGISVEDYQTQQAQLQQQLQTAYDPLFAELDRQLAALPAQREAGSSLVEQEYGVRGKELEATKAAQERALGYAETQQKEQTTMTLQDLAENARNWLSAAENIWGGSSAVPAVMTGMGKEISKARGGAFRTRANNLKEIAMKRVDLESLYGVQVDKIELWKTQQLQSVMDEYTAREDQIRKEEASAQTQMRAEAVNYATQQLQEIQNRVLDYNDKLNYWRTTKAEEFGYMLQELEARAQYKTPSTPNLQLKIGPGGETYLFNPQTGELSYAGAGQTSGATASTTQYGTQTSGYTKIGSQGQQLIWDDDWNDYIDSRTGLPEGY